MSNQARLILLSGVGGSGTTSLAAATAQAAEDEGLACVAVDATRTLGLGDALVAGAVVALVSGLQSEALPPEAWSGLASVAHLAAWQEIAAAVSEPGTDVVVVDAGSLREARALVQAPQILGRLVAAAMTPALAMRRTDEAGDGMQQDSAFDRLSGVRDTIAQIAALVESDRTTVRLITVPEESAVSQTLRALSGFAVQGVGVDAVVVNRCARKSDPLPREQREDQQAQVDRIEAYDPDVRVWKSTSSVRAIPKGRSVLGPLGDPVALRGGLRPRVEEEGYLLDLPLVGAARHEARVGRTGDVLVIEFDGIHRWIRLPSVLLRCRATHATRTPQGLTVSCVPDASLWRRPSGEGSAA